MPESETVMVVDPTTGGVKGSKLARFDLLPPDVLWALAEHYGQGSKKYADRNWEKGYDWGLSYAAAQRHANEFWAGHDTDEETGSLHVVAAAWHFMALAAFHMRGIGTDTRSAKPEGKPAAWWSKDGQIMDLISQTITEENAKQIQTYNNMTEEYLHPAGEDA